MYPTIKEGDTGEIVKVWQNVLGPPIKVDGIFGPLTKAATIEWQIEHDLPATGVVSTSTWDMVPRTTGERTSRTKPKKSLGAVGIFIGASLASILATGAYVGAKYIVRAAKL